MFWNGQKFLNKQNEKFPKYEWYASPYLQILLHLE